MKWRRIDYTREELAEDLKKEAKGLLGILIKTFLSKIVEIIIRSLLKNDRLYDPNGYPDETES